MFDLGLGIVLGRGLGPNSLFVLGLGIVLGPNSLFVLGPNSLFVLGLEIVLDLGLGPNSLFVCLIHGPSSLNRTRPLIEPFAPLLLCIY